MSTCSAPREGGDLRVGLLMPPSWASTNLLKKSSKMLPPLSDGPPREERWPLASAAWISQRCSVLGCPPGTMRLMVTFAGLTPHTSHILVAILDLSFSESLDSRSSSQEYTPDGPWITSAKGSVTHSPQRVSGDGSSAISSMPPGGQARRAPASDSETRKFDLGGVALRY